MAWKLDRQELADPNDRVSLSFSVDGPARFTLGVDGEGNTVLFAYRGQETDQEQEPDLAFDTDGSFWLGEEVR